MCECWTWSSFRTLAPAADVIMSVCNGSYARGMAALLNGESPTAHHFAYGSFPRLGAGLDDDCEGCAVVEDGKIATSGGLTSGIDLAMRVVERYLLRHRGRGSSRPDRTGGRRTPGPR